MKYYIWVLGCAMNYSDAERIGTVMDLLGYKKTDKESESDIIITVACSVRQTAIDRIYGKLKKWQKLKAKNEKLNIILSGCVLPEDKIKMSKSFDLIFDIAEIQKLTDYLSALSLSAQGSATEREGSQRGDVGRQDPLEVAVASRDYLSITPNHGSSFRAYVPIMTGCDNFCSYCAVPYTRGREQSRPLNDILSEVRDLVSRGYKEITLLGQNVNSYGYEQSLRGASATKQTQEIATTTPRDDDGAFISLLKKIDAIPGDYRVYFYSNHPKDFSTDLIKAIPELTHFPHYIHLPLQSGNDEILRSMNRGYTKADYLSLVQKIKNIIPDCVFTTDIMVGYPGESPKAFKETIELVKKVGFEMIFIGQYSERPGTKSAKLLDDVPKEEKKRRDRILTDELAKILEKKNEKIVGQTAKVLIDGEKAGIFYGRTDGYKVVEIKTDQLSEIGQFADVEVTDSSAWKLFGVISD